MEPGRAVEAVEHPWSARWLSHRALRLHLAVLLVTPACAVACWWQVTVALSGDSLGWLYSIEWPAFGVFGIIVWWNLIHDGPTTRRTDRAQEAVDPASPEPLDLVTTRRPEDEDPALAEYNDYLEALAGANRPKTWRRR